MAREQIKNATVAAPVEQPVAATTEVVKETTGDVSAAALTGAVAPVVAEPVVVETPKVAEPVVVQSQPIATATKAAAPAPKAAVKEVVQAVTTDTDLATALSRILKDVPPAYQTELNRIKAYIADMAPLKPIDPKKGAENQAALYRSVQGIINRQEKYFTPLFNALLKIVKSESEGVFHELNRHRFMEEVTLSASDRQALLNLTTLLCLVADPKSRVQVLKTIDINKALENGLTPQGRQRVMDFLNV